MSSPFSTPNAALEIAPPSAIELLWINHRPAVIGIFAGFCILVIIVLGILASNHSSRISSETLLSSATNEAGWREILAKYPNSTAGGDAMLLLAASLRDAGKLEESDTLYSRFSESFGRSPIAPSGLLGRASNARMADKSESAISSYQQGAAAYPQSYAAPFALFSQARLVAQQGKTEEVQRILQALGSQYPGSASAQAAGVVQRPSQAQN